MKNFNESENKVLSFMDQVQRQKEMEQDEENFKNSTDYKLKVLDKNEEEARKHYMHELMHKMYYDAIPLNDDYKRAYHDDIKKDFKRFMDNRCPEGIEFYVKEAIKKKSSFANKMNVAVEKLVEDEFKPKALSIEDTPTEDLIFNSDTDTQRRLDVVADDLSTQEISQAIKDNVKQSALSEITRAKEEKDKIKEIESELANDINVNNKEAVESALEFRGIGQTKDYTPTLFEGIMISKLNKILPMYESGELQSVYTYGVLKDYKENTEDTSEFASAEELAFIESVKEYTALSLLKALKMESFTKYRVEELAQEYAQQ